MGYTKDGSITNFWPDDTDDTFFVPNGAPLVEIMGRARHKWGADVQVEDLSIEARHIHTDCLYYDRYDGGDWTCFIEVTYIKAD